MNKLILLLTGLVCAHAAPQFVFVLPPEFLQQMQKPVGEASQPGQQPRIPFFPLESLLGSSTTLAESIVSAPVVPESLQAAKHLVEATPVMEVEQEQTAESTPVDVNVAPPINAVAEVALALSMAQEQNPISEEALVETTMAEVASLVVEAVPVEQEAPVKAVIMEEVITVHETLVDTPVQDVTSAPTIVIQNVTPIEEMVTPSIVEQVTENVVAVEEVVVQDVNTNTIEEVIIIEEVIPSYNAGTTQSPVVIPSTTVPSINSAPVIQVVDPRMSVDPRFRNYIYVNDAPDVVAAKIALFNLQAASLPIQQVI